MIPSVSDKDIDFTIKPLDSWKNLIGNEELRKTVVALLRHSGAKPRVFVAGPPGSGKSTVINYACKLAGCLAPIGEEPCGKCQGCREYGTPNPSYALYAYAVSLDRPVHYLPINCRRTTVAALHEQIDDFRFFHGTRIIHLEEAASLKRLGCDLSLTEIMDEPVYRDCFWFASAVTDRELDPQFRRRWASKVRTSPPTEQQLADLLARRCKQYNIAVDHPSTWQLLARRSWSVVGQAMAVLSAAIIQNDYRLTQKFVEEWPLPSHNPWHDVFFAT